MERQKYKFRLYIQVHIVADDEDQARAALENFKAGLDPDEMKGAMCEELIKPRPKIVCLCGSTKFYKEFTEINLEFTLENKIVLSIDAATKTDEEHFGHLGKEEMNKIKSNLDELHKRKIDLCDEVFIINPGGYIGESTRSEIDYALKIDKPVEYLESTNQT